MRAERATTALLVCGNRIYTRVLLDTSAWALIQYLFHVCRELTRMKLDNRLVKNVRNGIPVVCLQ